MTDPDLAALEGRLRTELAEARTRCAKGAQRAERPAD